MNISGNALQAMVDGWSAMDQKARAGSQWTLGDLISALEEMPPDREVGNLCDPHSYRGYYCDLAFENSGGNQPAGKLLDECKKAMGAVFEGYKGGDYVMGESTPIWVAEYGCCGEKIVGIDASGMFLTAPDA